MPKNEFSKLIQEDDLKKNLMKLDTKIKLSNAILEGKVKEYQKNVLALMGLDKLMYDKNKLVAQQAGVMASSALCFIPVFGPMAYSVVSSMIKSNSNTYTGMLLDGGMAAITYNATLMVTTGAQNNLNVGKEWTNTASPAHSKTGFGIAEMSGTGNMIASVVPITALLPKSLWGLQYGNSGTGKLLIPANNRMVTEKTLTYSNDILKDGLGWIKTPFEEGQLINIVFYNWISDFKIGGRGNLMLETGLVTESSRKDEKVGEDLTAEEYNAISYKSVTDIQTALKGLVRKSGWVVRGSRLQSTFAKFTPGNNFGYDKWFPEPKPDPAMTQAHISSLAHERNAIIGTICLFKARLIGYAPDYLAALKGSFGNELKESVVSNSLPEAFKTSGHGRFSSKVYETAVGLSNDQSDYKKHWALGVYAFHSILVHHLGTYNLSGLPAFGESDANDIAVRRALIDALATQWWITSAAWKQGQKTSVFSSKTVMNPNPACYQINMYTYEQLMAIPYIRYYFKAERVWKNFGASQKVYDSNLEIYGADKADQLMPEAKVAIARLVSNANQTVDQKARALSYQLADKYQNWPSVVNKVNLIENTPFILSLMPTQKEGADQLSRHIFSVLGHDKKSLYGALFIEPDHDKILEWIKDGLKTNVDIRSEDHQELAKASYGLMGTANANLKSYDAIHSKYSSQVYGQYQAENEDQDKIVQALTNLEMATKLQAAGDKAFNQVDFNREVLRALKHIVIYTNKATEKNPDFPHTIISH